MKLRHHPLLAGLALAAALALGAAATLLLVEGSIRLDGLRGRVAAALSRALGGEARIDGPLYLITGARPGIEADGLRLEGAPGAVHWSAHARVARLRLDLWALLAREIELSAVDLEDVRLCMAPGERGRAQRSARGGKGWRFAGIERLSAQRVSIVADASCSGEPLASVASLEASLPADRPLRLTALGSVKAAPWRAELRGPPLATLTAAAGSTPLELSAQLAGAKLEARLEAAPSLASVRAQLALDADDLLPLMRLFDAPFKSFGPLHAHAQLTADAAHIDLRLDEVRLEPASFAGRLSLERSGARPRAGIELHADALNVIALRRWFDASLDRARLQPGRLMGRIMGAVRASDGTLSLRIARLAAGPVALDDVGADGGWTDGVLRARLAARYANSPLRGVLEADMRGEEPALVLEAQAKAVVLPAEAGLDGTVDSVRTKLSARGAPGALAQSARGTLELRDARLRLPFAGGRLPTLVVGAAHGELGSSGWRLELAGLRFGQTRGRASVAGALPLTVRPIAARAEFELLDLAQLTQGKPQAGGAQWERALLPRGARLPDADLEIEAARVVLPHDGSMQAKGTASLRGGRISARLEGRDVSVPQFGATIGRVTLEASTSGATPAELAAGATLKLLARDGRVAIRTEAKPLEVSIAEASLSAEPRERTRASVAGTAFGLPLALQASAAPLSILLPEGAGEFQVSGRLGEVAADMEWHRAAPLRIKIDAPRLDAFDALLARSLPKTGPISLEATLHGLGEAQRSAEIAFALSESRLSGRIADERANGRRNIAIALGSDLLRLEDFGVPQRSAGSGHAPRASAGRLEAQVSRQLERAEAQVAALRRMLREVDGSLELYAARVTSGPADLGRGELKATLERGRLRVAPLRLDSPIGKLSLALDADLSAEDARYRLDGELDQFQYGVLLKGIDAVRRAEGKVSIRLALAARGPLDALATSAAGTADVVVFPTAYESRAIETWGGGLIHAMGAALDREKGARVNCAVAAFNVADGVARSQALMLDSTSMRAAGELEVELRDQRLKGFMAPKSKRPRLVSPQAPVGIGGTLEKPEVGVDVSGIPRAAVRTFYFVPAYLYDAFLSGAMPADGSEDCIRAYRRISTK